MSKTTFLEPKLPWENLKRKKSRKSKTRPKATKSMPQKKMLTIPEAARLLGIDPRTLRAAIRAKQVKAVPFATTTRVPHAEVLRLLAAADAERLTEADLEDLLSVEAKG